MAYLTRGASRIYFETYGEGTGPWVTLVNGFSRSSTDFRALARTLADHGYRVLTPDNRGAGRTEGPLDFSLGDIVDDVVALWDELGARHSHLLGISYGGVVSQRVSWFHGARVASLMLVSTSPSSRFLHPGNQLAAATPAEVEAEMTKYFSPGFIARNQLLFKSLLKETGKVFNDPVSRERARAQRNALDTFDFTADLAALTMPALVVHGDADGIIEVAAAEAFRRGLPQAQVEIYAGAGHLLLAETPRRLYETVLGFLEGL